MASELLESYLRRTEEVLRTGRFQNFLAQSHSRDVLRYLGVPPEEWPAYTASLDEDLVYTAQYLLYLGLVLKSSVETAATGDSNLTLGAEILEHVYSRSEDDDPERVCQLFTAALAYYMAGHFARAFVLIRDLEAEETLPRFLQPLRHLLLKEFGRLRADVIGRLVQTDYGDERLAQQVDAGELSEDGAICRVFEATLFRALSYFLEYAKTGAEPLLGTAESLLDDGIQLAVDMRFADWWWYYSSVRVMVSSYRRHSFWENLRPLLADETAAPMTTRYIRANLRLTTPVVELWPSQVTAVPHLFQANGRKNLCLRMPTSAGKTKIAELAILRFLTGHQFNSDAKCVYVAPFRSLAVEVEQTLKKVFLPLGVRVSELYGGFELTVADKLLIEKTQILVATPEKLDALFRFTPELVSAIKLVILDEGHIISPTTDYLTLRKARGLKYEVFLVRLVQRFKSADTRLLFLSAVMPNADQFAEWITGDREGLVSSDWRPSRLMMGEALWNGKSVTLEYTHADRKPLEQKCFVRGFVTQESGDALPGRRKKPFPKDDDEALALTAIEFAARGLTMVFVARKTSAEPFGRTVRDSIQLRRKMAEATGGTFALPVEPSHRTAIAACAALVREHMGEHCDVATFLEEGFVVHHGNLPQAVRLELERLVRAGAVSLVIATTTLAQGVNFPIHTVLVHSLDHGNNDLVSPMNFWNICGRAGRGMRENEGQVLFFVCESFDEWRSSSSRKKWLKKYSIDRQRGIWQKYCADERKKRLGYISAYGNYQVTSMLRELVFKVIDLWKEQHGTVDVPALCEALANHTLELFAPSEKLDLDNVLSSLDSFLLALTEGREEEEISTDTFQDILHRSLLHLQLTDKSELDTVNALFTARMRYVRTKHSDVVKRRQFYRLGLPLRDCEKIDAARTDLVALYSKAANYLKWTASERSEHLADVAEFLFQLSEIAPSQALPDCWRRLLFLWVSGRAPTEIAEDAEVTAEGVTAYQVSRWIDDVCGYRLPWGYNVLALYVKEIVEATAGEWPNVCDYYSAFAKYGVHEPVACWLLTFGVPSRRVAMQVAAAVEEELADPDALLKWLQGDGLGILEARGVEDDSITMLREATTGFGRQTRGTVRSSDAFKVAIRVPVKVASLLNVGDRLLIHRVSAGKEDGYRVFTLRGAKVGGYQFSERTDRLWEPLAKPELLDTVILSLEPAENDVLCRIEIASL